MLKLFSRMIDLSAEYYVIWRFAFSHGLSGIAVNEKVINGFWEQEHIRDFNQGLAPQVAIVNENSYAWGTVNKVIFTSRVVTSSSENNLVCGRLYTLPGNNFPSERPVLLIIPGWLTQNYQQYNEIYRQFLKQGFDCLILALPYHLERTPNGCFSGEKMFTPDLHHIMEALGQSISDYLMAINWLLTIGINSVGLLGFNLGGLIGGLLTTLEQRLAFASLWAPIPWLERALRHSDVCRPVKDLLFASGIHWRELSNCLEVFDPTHRQPVIDPQRIQFIQGTYDRLVRPNWVEKWWTEWNKPAFVHVPLGHFSLLKDAWVITQTIDFAKSCLNK